MELINLTNHPINILAKDKQKIITIPPSGILARSIQSTEQMGFIDYNGVQIPVTQTTYGRVIGVPDPQPGKAYIVSKIVAERFNSDLRDDIFIVNGIVKDPNGGRLGCLSLGRL